MERILAEKFANSQQNYFTMGSLEEELKKIGKLAGAEDIKIYSTKQMHIENFDIIDNPSSIINYSVPSENEEKLKRIGKELENFLTSKGYKAAILLVELTDLNSGKDSLSGSQESGRGGINAWRPGRIFPNLHSLDPANHRFF